MFHQNVIKDFCFLGYRYYRYSLTCSFAPTIYIIYAKIDKCGNNYNNYVIITIIIVVIVIITIIKFF